MAAYYVDTNNKIHMVTASEAYDDFRNYLDECTTGTLVVRRGRDNYGNTDESPDEYIERLYSEEGFNTEEGTIPEWIEKLENRGYLFVIVYILDHSGISISISSFNDPLDRGAAGFYVLTPEEMKEFKSENNAVKYVKEVVYEYDCWLNNNVWDIMDEELVNQDYIIANPFYMVRDTEDWDGDYNDMYFGYEDDGIEKYCEESAHLFWSTDYDEVLDFARKNVNKGVMDESLKDKIYTVTVTQTREITMNVLAPSIEDAEDLAAEYFPANKGSVVSNDAEVTGVKNEF